MEKTLLISFLLVVLLIPVVSGATVTVTSGNESYVGSNEIPTDFGMVTGKIVFRLGNLTWVPTEIWLLPQDINPDVFSKGLTQYSVLEIPNVTFSTCRTAVYKNQTSGTGFKIYNTGTTTQIFNDGMFCGLAFNGTYFVFARY